MGSGGQENPAVKRLDPFTRKAYGNRVEVQLSDLGNRFSQGGNPADQVFEAIGVGRGLAAVSGQEPGRT